MGAGHFHIESVLFSNDYTGSMCHTIYSLRKMEKEDRTGVYHE